MTEDIKLRRIRLLIVGTAILAMIIVGGGFGLEVAHRCEILAAPTRSCYESSGDLYLELYASAFDLTLNVSTTIFKYCGRVRDCQTSPCDYDYKVHQEYYCSYYRNNRPDLMIISFPGLYPRLLTSDGIFGFVVFIVGCACVPAFILVSSCALNRKSPSHTSIPDDIPEEHGITLDD